MSRITISSDCIRCGMCTAVCPVNVFSLDAVQGITIQRAEICIGCGHCMSNCPVDAINVAGLCADGNVADEPLVPYHSLCGLIRGRRSVRRFLTKSVSRHDIDELINVARYAPTARNCQAVNWTVVMSPARVQELTAIAVDWFREKGVKGIYMPWDMGVDTVCRHAPHLVIVHSDDSTARPTEDAIIALTTFELLAAAKGFGTCWAGYFMSSAQDYKPLQQALELPEGHKVRGALLLGYAAVRPTKIPCRNQAQVFYI